MNIYFSLLIFLLLCSCSAKAQTKPNIIIILADDMGYSDIGSFGSEIETPNLDALANEGLRITRFYNMSRCCPTRASLLTGLYPHQAGVGNMDDNRGFPSYQGYLNKSSVTIAEALKGAGYRTLMAGKWHVGSKPDQWPRKRGFDRYFGLLNGASSYFNINPYRRNQKLTIALDDAPYTPGDNFYATDTYTDYALKFIEENNNRQPFFLYLAFTAPHWPLHALPAEIAKYKGKYMKGWDKLREERYKRMVAMGIINKSTKLSPRDEKVPEWNSLTEVQKEEWDEKMAVYAAMIDRMDQNIGRLRQHLKKTGADKNTVIIFLSDNGGSHENTDAKSFTAETILASKKPASDPTSFTAYEHPGANVSNTPFRSFKHWEYEGGNATPFIAWYPKLIKPNTINHKQAHVIDLMPTCLDLAGIDYPTTYNGNAVTAKEGVSLLPVFKSQKWNGNDVLFFEHAGNRAVSKGDWKIVSSYPKNIWELYNTKNDRSELNDLSAKDPGTVKELEELYIQWAHRAGVIPWEQLIK